MKQLHEQPDHAGGEPRDPSVSPFILENMQNTARLIGSIGSEGMRLDIQEESISGSIGDVAVNALRIEGASILGTQGLFAKTRSTGLLFVTDTEIDGGVYSGVTSIHDIPSSPSLLMIIDMAGEGAYQVRAVRPKTLSFMQLVQLYRDGQTIPKDEVEHGEEIRTEEHKIVRMRSTDGAYKYFQAQEGQIIHRLMN